MSGLRDGLVETLIGVGGEVNGDARCRSECADDLDVEHHLAIRLPARRIGAARNRDRRDRGRLGNSEALEIARQIARAEATAEFDDGDCLAAAVGADRILIQRADLKRSVGLRGRRERPAKVRARNRTAVEPEHRDRLRG